MRHLHLPFLILVGVGLLYLPGLLQHFARPEADFRRPLQVISTEGAKGALSFPLVIDDAAGHRVVIAKRPQRVASLAPSLTESAFFVGGDARLAGRTRFCLWPPEAKAIPVRGGLTDPRVEDLLAARVDLVVATTITPADIQAALHRAGLKLLVFQHDSLTSIVRESEVLGALIGTGDYPARLSAERAQLAKFPIPEGAVANARPRVLVLYGLDGLYSAGRGTFVDDVIRRAGGENVAARASAAWPRLAFEQVRAWNPQVILIAVAQPEAEVGEQLRAQADALLADERWVGVEAIDADRVEVVYDSVLSVPGHRLLAFTQRLAERLAAIHE